MQLIDTDGNGTLEYSEFLAASVDRKRAGHGIISSNFIRK